MSDEPALLAAILAHPDEDTPRLIYADWLDENGRPERAEFIRLQCATELSGEGEERAAELEERNGARWLGGPAFAGTRWEFRRGFPECLSISVQLLLMRYEAFARVPWLRLLTVHHVNTTARAFDLPWDRRWVELELQEEPFLADATHDRTPFVAAVANWPGASHLRRLRLSPFVLTSDGASALAASPHLDNLQMLFLEGDRDDPRFGPLRERFGDRLVVG